MLNRPKLIQSTPYTWEQYQDVGCWQTTQEPTIIGRVIHKQTNGLMCTGCPSNGACNSQTQLWLRSNDPSRHPKPKPSETVREEAKRLNISIGEVRRRRQNAQ